jgi:uncharacterized protein (DUF2236 family)
LHPAQVYGGAARGSFEPQAACGGTSATIEGMTTLGPESASWRINGERAVVLGWPCAILMQFAHPLIAAGVAEHSSFRQSRLSPLVRLHGTIQAMLGLTFGDEPTAAAAADRINRIHDHVTGTLPESAGPYRAGTPYSAHDPELLAWVQLTLLDTMPRAYDLLVGPLARADKDAYCVEARVGAARLGLPGELIPATFDEVSRTVSARLTDGSLMVTEAARALARDILTPGTPAPWPLGRIHRLITVGLLPAELRKAYGLSWSIRDERALARWSAGLRWASLRTPAALRRWRAARRDGCSRL